MDGVRGVAGPQHEPNSPGRGSTAPTGAASPPEPSPQSSARTRIFLARHGRTPLNAAGVLRGHLDPELDEVGAVQAALLGDVIGRMDLQLVVSSPLRRAVETATAIAARAGTDVEVDRRLIDRDYSQWAGMPREEVAGRWGSVDAAPGVEPEHDVLDRALAALTDLCRRVPDGSVAVVSHDVVNRLVLTALDRSLEAAGIPGQDTGCFNVIEHRSGRWSVRSVNNAPGGHEAARS